MDKLKALQYFIASAEEGSFTGAARRLKVSVPSISKLIGLLEIEIGALLLARSTQGLKLTSKGAAYLETCVPLIRQLADADQAASNTFAQPERTLIVGAPGLLSRLVLVPALKQFRENFPNIQVDLRAIDHLTVTDAQAQGLDVLVAMGWPGDVNLIQRPLAQSRLIVCASPAYWEKHGIPLRPKDLASHQCLLVRSPEGTTLDLWRHTKGAESEEVAVGGWLVSESRDYVLQAVIQGLGVGRFADLSVWSCIKNCTLQPVLVDWGSQDAPPFSALYRPDARQDQQVQSFVTFVERLLSTVEEECRAAIGPRILTVRPTWYGKRKRRASTMTNHPTYETATSST